MSDHQAQAVAPVTVEPGQSRRRKRDGVLTTVLSVDPGWRGAQRSVWHQGRRRTCTEYHAFLRKYEAVPAPATVSTAGAKEPADD